MNLKFKRPSIKTQELMSDVAIGKNTNDFHCLSKEKLSQVNNHKFAKLVNSGNAAIMAAMNAIDGAIIIPDQGAWNGFKQIAKFLNKDSIQIKTDKGLVKSEILEDFLNHCVEENIISSDNENEKSALFLTSFAAYTAEHDIKEISQILHENNLLLVEDASGAICDYKNNLANGKYSDIIIGSTGSPKIINVGDGGFITTNDESLFNKSNLLLKTSKCSNITASGIYSEIDFAKENLKQTVSFTKCLRNRIEDETDFEVFHIDKRGINLILKTSDPKSLSYKLRQEFSLDNHGMITKCPNYNRLKEKAVAIEIKNLDLTCLNESNLEEMVNTVKKYDSLA